MQRTEAARTLAPIERQPVKSSHLKSVGYNEETEELEVEFQSGEVYRYLKVPPVVYEELLSAESKGKYFNSRIRGMYQVEKLGKD